MLYDKLSESSKFINNIITSKPSIGIILGSGLGSLVERVNVEHTISYNDIPHFPKSSLEGHAGNLVFGTIGDQHVMIMQGRFHYYEGFPMKEVTYPIYLMKHLGVESMIVTNACGGINPSFKPGDLMIIEDFINSVSSNPLIGANDDRLGPRFPDMSDPFNTQLRNKAKEVATSLNIDYKEGVYTFFQGPYYETRAEIRMYGKMGSDAIGMSTVPETIVANYLGIKVLGISCITNMATGLRDGKHSHAEVVEIANQASVKLCNWVEALIKTW